MQQLDPSLASQLQGTGPGGMPTQADAAQAQTKQAEAESQRQDILTKVMAPDAKERLARISLVKPDKARKLEEMVMMMAQRGQLREQLSDAQLKQMLEQIGGAEGPGASEIKYDRRRFVDDDDSDIDLDGL